MSSLFSIGGMSSSKKEKNYANRGAHRQSIVVSHGKKRKKDTDSVSVSSSASTVVPAPPQCPLRPYLQPMFEAMFEPEPTEEKQSGEEQRRSTCPLRRIRLSHTVPFFTIIMMNLWLVALTLILTGACRWIYDIWLKGSCIARQIWEHSTTAMHHSEMIPTKSVSIA
ncbi:MAG: hypothetical protein M1818_008528 [Claussenomyces sp. TS43310]|nr:MAG: hypothetical protein M1818_008528 [Claussenomyces sp. TS43310]